MPNHIKNIIKIVSDDPNEIKKVLSNIKVDKPGLDMNTIDFEKIIPMPKSLMIEAGSNTDKSITLYLTKLDPDAPYFGCENEKLSKQDFDDVKKIMDHKYLSSRTTYTPISEDKIHDYTQSNEIDKMLTLGQTAYENVKNYGCATWYDWSRENWGTKWNAYDFEKGEDNTIEFFSAWSPPACVTKELSRLYPNVTIEHGFTDEGLGYNTGTFIFKSGTIASHHIFEDGSKEAFDNSMKLYHTNPEIEGIYPSFDGKTYVFDSNDYQVCFVKGELCLYSPFSHSPSQIPAGFYTYFSDGENLSSDNCSSSVGIVLSKTAFALNKNGKTEFEQGDIKVTDETMCLQSFSIHEENILSETMNENFEQTMYWLSKEDLW